MAIPTLVSATVIAPGDVLQTVYSEAVTDGGATGTVSGSGISATVLGLSGSGTTTLLWSITTRIPNGRVVVWDIGSGAALSVSTSEASAAVVAGAIANLSPFYTNGRVNRVNRVSRR